MLFEIFFGLSFYKQSAMLFCQVIRIGSPHTQVTQVSVAPALFGSKGGEPLAWGGGPNSEEGRHSALYYNPSTIPWFRPKYNLSRA